MLQYSNLKYQNTDKFYFWSVIMGFWNSIADKLDDMVNNWTVSQVESALDDIEKIYGTVRN